MREIGFPQPEPGGHKEPMWREDKLLDWLSKAKSTQTIMLGRTRLNDEVRGGHFKMGDVNVAYDEAREVIEKAAAAYSKTIADFRGTIKNDLTSISAASDRVTGEVGKMQRAYDKCALLLTSAEMVAAIGNAERLAAALGAISALQSHSITFAVLDKKTQT